MADSKKIAGILIENTFKSVNNIQSIVGIGLNVNQNSFEGLDKATSIYKELGIEVDQELLLNELLEKIINNIDIYTKQGGDLFWNLFHDFLFMKDCNCTFIDNKTNSTFKGCILGVTKQGLLHVRTEDEDLFFGIKEVTLLY